ncbi:O-antigen ligase [Mesocricetibacter intestinalis]|uniref:O-antigen ligase n=2 Tax=Mesocricetibacter intestinalis TaxID=1521930 RepID=A0A4R6V9T1_9PAST|nr:O-antigen ligase [Mesocricetibacter intestinalis]
MTTKTFVILINLLVSAFFMLQVCIKGGYNYSPVLLMVFGLGYLLYFRLIKKASWRLSSDERWLAFSYVVYFAVFVLSFWLHEGRLKELDNPSRIIFMLPLLLLFSRFPLSPKGLWYAMPAAGIVAGICALFDVFYRQQPMAFAGRIMHIQGGDISMSIGMFSLAIGIYFFIRKRPMLMIFALVGALCGVMGSILSTARGGWIGLPVIIGFILWAYRQSLSKTFFISIFTLMALALTTMALIPQTRVTDRLEQARHEIQVYMERQDGSTSVGARFDMWKSALLMAREKPLLGWGEEGVSFERKAQHERGLIGKYAAQFNHAHNQYLDDLSKRGILGLLTLMAIFLIPLRFFLRYVGASSAELKTLGVMGSVHVLSVMFYCISQGFFTHNSGNIFYFFPLLIFYTLILNLSAANQRTD